MPFGNRKNILEDLLSSVLLRLKKYHPSEKLKFNNLGIFQSLKFRILMGKILPVSLNLNFTPNTLGCYGLMCFSVCVDKLSFHHAAYQREKCVAID